MSRKDEIEKLFGSLSSSDEADNGSGPPTEALTRPLAPPLRATIEPSDRLPAEADRVNPPPTGPPTRPTALKVGTVIQRSDGQQRRKIRLLSTPPPPRPPLRRDRNPPKSGAPPNAAPPPPKPQPRRDRDPPRVPPGTAPPLRARGPTTRPSASRPPPPPASSEPRNEPRYRIPRISVAAVTVHQPGSPVTPGTIKVRLGDGQTVEVPWHAAHITRKYRATTPAGRWLIRFDRRGQTRTTRRLPDPLRPERRGEV